MAAALSLGADGVQIGTLFVATKECNASPLFKQKIVEAGETGTAFVARRYRPQRILKNPFAERIAKLDASGATGDDIRDAYGPDRGRLGAIEGDWENGYFNCGQGACLIGEVRSVKDAVERLVAEYNNTIVSLRGTSFVLSLSKDEEMIRGSTSSPRTEAGSQ